MRSSTTLVLLGTSVTSRAQVTSPAPTQVTTTVPSVVGGFDPAAFHAVNGTDDFWKVASENACTGLQYEYGSCQLDPCDQLEVIDCVFDEWSSWGHCDCTGLKSRSRVILTTNNEKGQPCDGDITQTERCKAPCHEMVNCSMSDWSPWSVCADRHAQKTRTRTIEVMPANGGTPCDGVTQDTMPCGDPEPPTKCAFSQWGSWNDCSQRCGGGHHTRHRSIDVESTNGGELCEGDLKEVEMCNVDPCGAPQPCLLGDWKEWTGCDTQNPLQKVRRRSVEQAAKDGGAGCEDDLKEIQACVIPEKVPQPCELANWEEWSQCDKTCDGGKQFRTRTLGSDPQNGGTCGPYALRETKACHTNSCILNNGTDCELSKWSEWSECSAECGIGQRKRSREVLQKMEEGGKGCTDVLVSIEKCVASSCVVTDCTWDEWQEWSGCTCSCDGGTKTRNRQIKTAPLNGGALCEAHAKTEVAACGTDPCAPPQCRDAQWGEWLTWGDCSVTCGSGFKKRKRLLDVEASSCGATVNGTREEFEVCNAGKCSGDEPCVFSDWQPWSDCSCSCYGVAERSRTIAQYSTGKGDACVGPTKQVQPCNPGLLDGFNHTFDTAPSECDKIQPPVDCEMEEWKEWTDCSKSCGGGHRSRLRDIATPNKNDGKPCNANLTHISTVTCSTEPCDRNCEDCKWDAWSEWSDCSSSGQKHRQRQIDTPANYCGEPCPLKAASEVTDCEPPLANLMHCVWSQWAEWSECSKTCGSSEQTQSRKLTKVSDVKEETEVLYSGDDASMVACFGDQKATRSCVGTDENGYESVCPDLCSPIDCKFGKWGKWHKPSCEGLCIRSRVVDQINNGCGQPCNGPLIETKKCWDEVECGKPEDCVWTPWNDWTVCQSPLDHKERTREIDKQPRHDGKACFGSAQQVEPCGTTAPPEQIDCKAADWGSWSRCTATCGGGTQTRTRYLETAAQNGGLPCTESLKEVDHCADVQCESPGRDCVLGSWSEWSACNDALQQTRHRAVDVSPSGSGSTCSEELSQTTPCEVTVVDCEMSPWTGWETCDKTCGGGQQSRHREVHVPPSAGGAFCDEELKQTQPCNDDPCTVRSDCEMSDWSEWSTPAVTCGTCQQKSTRDITQTASAGGYGCKLSDLTKMRGCLNSDGTPLQPCTDDVKECVWNDWGPWDACSCPCGRGTHRRTRSILQAPTGKGPGCAAEAKLQVKPCNTQPCEECRDGVWGDWTVWGECSRTCGGGTKRRTRHIEQDANFCGDPVAGNTSEIAQCGTESCSQPIDCELNDWSEWSSCSCTCFGTRSRSRSIGVQGRADGKFCEDATQEIQTCHPLAGETPPEGCVKDMNPVNCEFAEWTEWAECSSSCGMGQRNRARQVAVKAADGGRGCSGPMQEVSPCSIKDCEVTESKDCVWNDWGDWSACTKCAGQTFRTRSIHAMNEGGGSPCEANAGQQTKGCDVRKCHEPTYCLWGDWAEWEGCSVSCGEGKRQRSRKLVISHEKPEPEQLYEKYAKQNAELRRRTDSVENARIQEMAISFASGALSLVAFFTIARGFRSSPRGATQRAAPIFADEAVE